MSAFQNVYIQARTQQTAPFTPSGTGVNIATPFLNNARTLVMIVHSLTGGGNARLTLKDSVNALTNTLTVCSWNPFADLKSYTKTWQIHRDLPSFRLAVASAVATLILEDLTGTSPMIDYECFVY